LVDALGHLVDVALLSVEYVFFVGVELREEGARSESPLVHILDFEANVEGEDEVLLILAEDYSLLFLEQSDLALLDEVAKQAVVTPRKDVWHVAVDVHVHHFVLGVAEHVADIASDLQDFAALLDEVDIYGAMLGVEHVHFGLVEESLLYLLLALELLKLEAA